MLLSSCQDVGFRLLFWSSYDVVLCFYVFFVVWLYFRIYSVQVWMQCFFHILFQLGCSFSIVFLVKDVLILNILVSLLGCSPVVFLLCSFLIRMQSLVQYSGLVRMQFIFPFQVGCIVLYIVQTYFQAWTQVFSFSFEVGCRFFSTLLTQDVAFVVQSFPVKMQFFKYFSRTRMYVLFDYDLLVQLGCNCSCIFSSLDVVCSRIPGQDVVCLYSLVQLGCGMCLSSFLNRMSFLHSFQVRVWVFLCLLKLGCVFVSLSQLGCVF